MLRKFAAEGRKLMGRAFSLGLTLAVCVATMLVASNAMAQAAVTLPDIDVDVTGTATAIGTALGAIVASIIGLFGAFYIVRIGVRWIRSMVK